MAGYFSDQVMALCLGWMIGDEDGSPIATGDWAVQLVVGGQAVRPFVEVYPTTWATVAPSGDESSVLMSNKVDFNYEFQLDWDTFFYYKLYYINVIGGGYNIYKAYPSGYVEEHGRGGLYTFRVGIVGADQHLVGRFRIGMDLGE